MVQNNIQNHFKFFNSLFIFDVYCSYRKPLLLKVNAKGVKPMTFRKNMHDGIKVSEIEERRYGRKY